MPKYKFQHRETGKTKTIDMKISERDIFVKENPEWVQQITGFPGSIQRRPQPSNGFKDHLKHIKSQNYGSNINDWGITEV